MENKILEYDSFVSYWIMNLLYSLICNDKNDCLVNNVDVSVLGAMEIVAVGLKETMVT